MLDVKEGFKILSNILRRKDIIKGMPFAIYIFLDNTNKIDPSAIKLVKELDGLPLALSIASVYLKHVSVTFSDYLRLYKASWLKL